MRVLVFLILWIISLCETVNANTSEIVAIVDNVSITNRDLDENTEFIMKISSMPITEANFAAAKRDVLEDMINNILLKNEANKMKIFVSEKDLQNMLSNIANNFGIKPHNLKDKIEKEGISYELFIKRASQQILFEKFLDAAIRPTVTLSNNEIMENANVKGPNTKYDKPTSFNLAEIVLTPQNQEEASILINMVYKALKAGKKFGDVAAQLSDSPSKQWGGKIGWIDSSQLDPAVLHAISSLSKNSVSQPIPSGSNVIILNLIDKKSEFITVQSGQLESKELKNFLYSRKLMNSVDHFIQKLRDKAFIEYKK